MAERRRRKSAASQIEDRDRETPVESEEFVGPDPYKIDSNKLIPSGSTLINCACSDNPFGAFAMGTINTVPGKSGSGKSIVILTALACCASDDRFDEYDLVLDDGEQTLSFDMESLFEPLLPIDGQPRLLAPNYDKQTQDPIPSETIQNFKQSVLRFCDKGKPFIYVLDSLDSLSSDEELEREYKAMLKAAIESKNADMVTKVSGSYKAEKAKHIGETLRIINGRLKHTDSALFIIQQTRQRFNKSFGQTDWVTAGGEAPYFYSFHQMYLNRIKSDPREAKGLRHVVGGFTQIEITKNKLTGKKRKDGIVIPIYESYGVDDIGSCIDFLKKTKHWRSDSGGITASEFDVKISRDRLINYIEKNDLQKDLQQVVGQVWNEAEKAMQLNRKRKF